MADFYAAGDQGLAAPKNPIAFQCDVARETALARSSRGEWPSDVAVAVIAAADAIEPLVGAALAQHDLARQTFTPAALPEKLATIATEARQSFAKVDGSTKLWSEANTERAALRPTPTKYFVGGERAPTTDPAARDARWREIRGYDANRQVADVRGSLVAEASRFDDEGYLSHNFDPVASARDHVLDPGTRERLEREWLARSGQRQRIEALEAGARVIDGVAAAADAAIATWAGPAPGQTSPVLRVAADGSLVPVVEG